MNELLHPYLKPVCLDAASVWVGEGSDNRTIIAELLQRLAAEYPAAGRAYHVTRCWNALCWQPMFLALASVHGTQTVPELRRIRMQVHALSIYGYQLSSTGGMRLWNESEAIENASNQLRQLFETFYDDVKATGPFSRYLAANLLADTCLEGLARLTRLPDPRSPEAMQTLAGQWLRALNLPGKGGLVERDGHLVVKRLSCCLHHRIDSSDRCDNCPGTSKMF